ncbi:hypothetical protein [Loktanella sp. Alg231-35]|uniref:hypothetical protein n=1 Tax=Loktanella sp. Alg231-35 TaxID=1922220 RepID=UPI000D55C6AF|nr:hypothetical protein [Loktanella sp. Alg231-35]
MADTTQKTSIPPNGAFPAVVGFVTAALHAIDKVWISQGVANARLRKVEKLNAKSDEDLAKLGLHRDDIIRIVFRDRIDT